jgi:hypothetical protein
LLLRSRAVGGVLLLLGRRLLVRWVLRRSRRNVAVLALDGKRSSIASVGLLRRGSGCLRRRDGVLVLEGSLMLLRVGRSGARRVLSGVSLLLLLLLLTVLLLELLLLTMVRLGHLVVSDGSVRSERKPDGRRLPLTRRSGGGLTGRNVARPRRRCGRGLTRRDVLLVGSWGWLSRRRLVPLIRQRRRRPTWR